MATLAMATFQHEIARKKVTLLRSLRSERHLFVSRGSMGGRHFFALRGPVMYDARHGLQRESTLVRQKMTLTPGRYDI